MKLGPRSFSRKGINTSSHTFVFRRYYSNYSYELTVTTDGVLNFAQSLYSIARAWERNTEMRGKKFVQIILKLRYHCRETLRDDV